MRALIASENLLEGTFDPWRRRQAAAVIGCTSSVTTLERYSPIRMAAKREAMAGVTLRPMIANSEVVLVASRPAAIQ